MAVEVTADVVLLKERGRLAAEPLLAELRRAPRQAERPIDGRLVGRFRQRLERRKVLRRARRPDEGGTEALRLGDDELDRYKQRAEDLQRYLEPLVDHDTTDRLPQISAPALVLAGGRDPGARPALGRRVAELIPAARFEVMERGGASALPGGAG